MLETRYRASRIARVLGNPLIYEMLRFMGARRVTPTQIANHLKRSAPTVSNYLRSAKLAELVRYETASNPGRGHGTEYWLKDPRILEVLTELEAFVERSRKQTE